MEVLISDIILRELNLKTKTEKENSCFNGRLYLVEDIIFHVMQIRFLLIHTTLTGSIGVFGIVPNSKKLLNDKLGVYVDTVNTHKYSDIRKRK